MRFNRSFSILPSAVKGLLIANVAVFGMEITAGGGTWISWLALWPPGHGVWVGAEPSTPGFHFWQLVSYAFLHGSVLHLALNLYALWLFGARMENWWGSGPFLVYYLVCVIGAALTQLYVTGQGWGPAGAGPTIGASGGVYGLLLAFGMTFPEERLLLLFPPVALQAKWFVLIFGTIELWSGVTATAAGVAHFAHLGGMLFGFLLLWFWRRHPPNWQ